MMQISLARWLAESAACRREPSLALLIDALAESGKTIAHAVRQASLVGLQGAAESVNCQDEQQKKLDIFANDTVIRLTAACDALAGIASEENEAPVLTAHPNGRHLLFIDPLDGSSNIDVNVTVGTIFSIYRRASTDAPPETAEFLRPGSEQIAAGYIAYGPATQLVLSVGDGVAVFTLSPTTGSFYRVADRVTIPAETREFAVNASRARFWFTPFRHYIDGLLAGETGPRGHDYNMRWIASMVADVHRIVTRGGIFMYPADHKVAGRLRLMYEANPMAFLMAQAGGHATDGVVPILDIVPERIHQRVGVILGSRTEVDYATACIRQEA